MKPSELEVVALVVGIAASIVGMSAEIAAENSQIAAIEAYVSKDMKIVHWKNSVFHLVAENSEIAAENFEIAVGNSEIAAGNSEIPFEIAAHEAHEINVLDDTKTVHWRKSVFHLGKGEGDTWRKLVSGRLRISFDCRERTIQK